MRRADLDWANICLSVIGGDPSEQGQQQNEEMARLHALRDELGLQDLITFLGARDQDTLAFLLRRCRMFWSCLRITNLWHGRARGHGVRHTRHRRRMSAASANWCKHNQTGLRVKVNDPDRAGRAMEKLLLTDEARRRRIGHSAACYAEDYSWLKVVDKLLAVYGELIAHSQ